MTSGGKDIHSVSCWLASDSFVVFSRAILRRNFVEGKRSVGDFWRENCGELQGVFVGNF